MCGSTLLTQSGCRWAHGGSISVSRVCMVWGGGGPEAASQFLGCMVRGGGGPEAAQ